jgi:hypothetical protein
MKINCKFCDTQVLVKNEIIYMQCMCDEEFRMASLDKIKYGFHNDRVYLLDNTQERNCIYDQVEQNKQKGSVCNVR